MVGRFLPVGKNLNVAADPPHLYSSWDEKQPFSNDRFWP